MKIRLVGILILLLFVNGNIKAQVFDKQILKDSIINLSFNQLSRVDMIVASEKLTETNKGIDPIIAEAVVYAICKNKVRLDVDELCGELTGDQLFSVVSFMNSKAYFCLQSNEFADALEMLFCKDIKGFFTDSESWTFNISPLNDKKFDELADKYIKLTNDVEIINKRIELLVLRLKNEMGVDDANLVTTVTKQIQDNFHLYYKNVLVNYIGKEQLQEVVDFYSQPYMVSRNRIINPARMSIIEIMEDSKVFDKMIKDSYGSLIRVKDTTSIVQDYLNRLQHIPMYTRAIPNDFTQTLTLKGKSAYNGQTRDGQAHGKGVLIDKKGTCYSGDYKMGKRHGLVTTYYINGDSIIQMWADDKVIEIQNTDLSKSVALFKGKAMGYGFRIYEGIREEGLFVDDNLVGYAKREYIDRNTIEEGWFENGIMTKGCVTIRNTEIEYSVFEGEQIYSQQCGLIRVGTVTTFSKKDGVDIKLVEKGDFIGQELNGIGYIELMQGESHQTEEGYFSNGKLYGKGVKKNSFVGPDNWNCHQTISGIFHKGILSNEITYEENIDNISNTSADYTAWTITRLGLDFSFGIPRQVANEVGSASLSVHIRGDVRNEKLNGKAEVFLSNGDYYKGTFINGYFLSGDARITNSDRSIYEGGVISGRYEGDGKLIYEDGSYDEGLFMFGSFVNGVRKDKDGEVLYNIRTQRLN